MEGEIGTELDLFIPMMRERMGRTPTVDEVYDFIFGDEETRAKILRGEG